MGSCCLQTAVERSLTGRGRREENETRVRSAQCTGAAPAGRRSPPRTVTTVSLRPADLRRYRRAVLRPFKIRTAGQCRRFVEALGVCYAFPSRPRGPPRLLDGIGTPSNARENG